MTLLDLDTCQRSRDTSGDDRLRAENAALRAEIAGAKLDRDVAYIRHHPLQVTGGVGGRTGPIPEPDDAAIVTRIIDAHAAAGRSELTNDGSWWFMQIADIRRAEHDIVVAGDFGAVTRMLRDPQGNNLFYGFDNLAKALSQQGETWPSVQGALCYDSLLTLAEAVGAVRLDLPEAPIRTDIPDVEMLLRALDTAFGFTVDFPNPFPGEVGLETSRGLASYRCFQALYQAWRIMRLAPRGTIVEIGGGLGRTAYYAMRFGAAAYSIIDLPLSGVAQAYFLDRAGMPVRLFGEPEGHAPDATKDRRSVAILPPSAFHDSAQPVDLVVNVDSFTEMAPETTRRYVDKASDLTGRLLSINHEFNGHRMFDLFASHPRIAHATRAPYWLRRGFVEELATFGGAS